VRARFCERLAELAPDGDPTQAFLMGLFSMLDALIDQPLDEALRSVGLAPDVTEALLGNAPQGSSLGQLYGLTQHYEHAEWDAVEQLSSECGIPLPATGDAYLDSTDWAQSVIQMSGD
jgi:c-di-GMP-related signal transduction protein